MQYAPHLTLERIVNHLVLAHTRHTGELRADDFRLPVIIVSGEVGQRDLGLRKGFRQIFHQRVAAHSHDSLLVTAGD